MLTASLKKNDPKAKWLIITFSIIVFAVVSILGRYNLAGKVNLSFDVHIFAKINASINATVALLLLAGLFFAKQKNYALHKKVMLTAMALSVLFLVSYICHHLLAGETRFGATGTIRTIYYIILGTHIPLAGLALPFILFAAYRALIGEYDRHKKMVRIIWPVWFYVAVTGVVVYLMIHPFYK